MTIATVPFSAERFFKQAMQSQTLAHAYILKGRDYGLMYRLAMDVARALNCQNPPASGEACGECTDCRWAAGNAHPAVMTISRLSYLVSERGEDLDEDALEKAAKKSAATQIKAEQVERLLVQLGLSTQHNRVVIFCDAEERPASEPSAVTPPYEWASLKANQEKSFHIRPLERRLFNAASANRFLKTLEEPPPRTLFFFIAETEEQLLDTIVSRCQVIPVGGGLADAASGQRLGAHAPFFDRWISGFRRPRADVYLLGGEFEQYFAEQGLSMPQALDLFQQYLRERYLHPSVETGVFDRYRAAQRPVDEARRMLQSKTNEAQVLVQLFLNLREPLMRLG